MKPVLFLHVPKTSGTSLKRFFKESIEGFYLQANSRHQLEQGDPHLGPVKNLDDVIGILATHPGLALHVDSDFGPVQTTSTFRSLAWLLFEPAHARLFEQFTVVTMLREPFSRFRSESAFLEQKQSIDRDFLPDAVARSMEQHLERTAENATLQFLLAKEFRRRSALTDRDLDRAKSRILDNPIHVGIYERHAESMAYFSHVIGRPFGPRDLPTHNAVGEKPPVPAGLEEAFRLRNRLDYALYEFAVELFDRRLREASA